jgi:hypothetical protein
MAAAARLTDRHGSPTVLAMRACALLLLAALGCAHAPRAAPSRTADPAATLRAWSDAIARDDPHAAWRLLSPALRAHLGESDFILQWKAAAADLSAQRDALQAGAVVRRAAAAAPDGRAWPLVHEDAHWRLAAPRPTEVGGETPEDTLRRLVAAVKARDLDAVLALLAEPLRTTVEQALGDRLTGLEAALRQGPIDSAGNLARVRYNSRYHIDLIRENGRWRVADFN